jgi:hypothetical protein
MVIQHRHNVSADAEPRPAFSSGLGLILLAAL